MYKAANVYYSSLKDSIEVRSRIVLNQRYVCMYVCIENCHVLPVSAGISVSISALSVSKRAYVYCIALYSGW